MKPKEPRVVKSKRVNEAAPFRAYELRLEPKRGERGVRTIEDRLAKAERAVVRAARAWRLAQECYLACDDDNVASDFRRLEVLLTVAVERLEAVRKGKP